ncbi:MAG: lipopolysaccharide biosynthesis protein [Candidatus Jordarchaeum sp.]|uniref:lipopolysaccharide biosynthesis protein n=1 Tax=Candidatus Jordarchaeum sp. TaxID=2823881 RepID=UPI00404A5D16
MTSLKRRVFQGLAWRTSVDVGEMFLQIVFTAILARILTKADFGLVAMALLVNRFLTQMTQIGFGIAIIQSQNIRKEQVSAIFYINAAVNFMVSSAGYAVAPLAAGFFNQPKLIPLIRVLVWVIFINSFGFPHILLRKKLKFGGISLLEISTMLTANIVAVIIAIKGFGFWALAARAFLSQLLFAIGIWFIGDWFPGRPDFRGVKRLFSFGLNMLGSKIFNYFSQNLAAIITGKFIGVETLGAFNIAYNLALVPAQKVQSILTAVLTPAFSALQANLINFRRKVFETLYSLGSILIPSMLGLSVIAPNFVVTLYGPKWKDAGLFLVFLAPIGLMKGIEHLLASVIISRGWPSVILMITFLETLASVPLLFLGSYFFDIIGLIVAYFFIAIFSLALTISYSQKAVGDTNMFIRATKKSFFNSSLMVISVIMFSKVFPLKGVLELLGQFLVGATIYLICRIRFITDKERNMIKDLPFSNLPFLKNLKS